MSSAAVPKKLKSVPAPRLKKEEVWYLALEGGGGKGVTYLGAIEALENLQVLPLNKPPGKNQILGIAGASAGAITALVLALGYKSADIKKLLETPDRFNAFFDGPNPGKYRVVDQKGQLQAGFDPGVDAGVVEDRQVGIGKVIPAVISKLLPKSEDPIVTAIARDVAGYLYNLIFDRGLFPGFTVNEFFRNLLRDYFERQPQRGSAAAKSDPGLIGFKEFYDKTKIDLIFTGVNSTSKQVGMWSRKLTPKFSIADAVSISMNLPLVFKPVRVDPSLELTTFGANAMRYDGYWFDGGVLDNLPLHAFDEFNDNPNLNVIPGLSGLHPKVLGLRLTPGFPDKKLLPPTPPTPLDQPFFSILTTYLHDVLDTLLTPSEEGQIRTPQERSQLIELFTGELSTTEFAPPQSKSDWPVKNAKEVVAKYFAH